MRCFFASIALIVSGGVYGSMIYVTEGHGAGNVLYEHARGCTDMKSLGSHTISLREHVSLFPVMRSAF